MTTHFLKNLYLGSELTDEQLKEITQARTELHIHVLYKNLQVSNLLPILHIYLFCQSILKVLLFYRLDVY